MAMSKESLADKLVARSKNGGRRGSVLNPVKSDGLNVVTLGQELGILSGLVNDKKGWSALNAMKDKKYGPGLDRWLDNLVDVKQRSGQLFVGSTVLGFVANLAKRRGKTVRSGILKLN